MGDERFGGGRRDGDGMRVMLAPSQPARQASPKRQAAPVSVRGMGSGGGCMVSLCAALHILRVADGKKSLFVVRWALMVPKMDELAPAAYVINHPSRSKCLLYRATGGRALSELSLFSDEPACLAAWRALSEKGVGVVGVLMSR